MGCGNSRQTIDDDLGKYRYFYKNTAEFNTYFGFLNKNQSIDMIISNYEQLNEFKKFICINKESNLLLIRQK